MEHPTQDQRSRRGKNYLALATALMTKMSTFTNNKQNGSSGKGKENDQTYQAWRYENPENKATKEVRGSTMKWCTNDCHDQPMWCAHKKT